MMSMIMVVMMVVNDEDDDDTCDDDDDDDGDEDDDDSDDDDDGNFLYLHAICMVHVGLIRMPCAEAMLKTGFLLGLIQPFDPADGLDHLLLIAFFLG